MIFPKHLEVLKEFYGNPHACGVAIGDKSQSMVLTIIFEWDLDAKKRLFNLTMKSNVAQAMAKISTLVIDKVNPQIVNPFTHLWKVINVFQLLSHTFLEDPKLAKIAMIHILGSIVDERCFNYVSFLKCKL